VATKAEVEGKKPVWRRLRGSPGERSNYDIISLGSDGRDGGNGNAADIKVSGR
jgi:hypothetical protein